jgi:hypothetical protein
MLSEICFREKSITVIRQRYYFEGDRSMIVICAEEVKYVALGGATVYLTMPQSIILE